MSAVTASGRRSGWLRALLVAVLIVAGLGLVAAGALGLPRLALERAGLLAAPAAPELAAAVQRRAVDQLEQESALAARAARIQSRELALAQREAELQQRESALVAALIAAGAGPAAVEMAPENLRQAALLLQNLPPAAAARRMEAMAVAAAGRLFLLLPDAFGAAVLEQLTPTAAAAIMNRIGQGGLTGSGNLDTGGASP